MTFSDAGFVFLPCGVEEEAALTATVQDGTGYEPGSPNTVSTRIVVADPAVTASFEQAAYTFDEAGGDATVAVILRTATGVPSPNREIFFSISTAPISGQAEDVNDYVHQSGVFLSVLPSDFTLDGADFTARKEVTLVIVDDAIHEPDETLNMLLEPAPGTSELVALRQPDGTACPGIGDSCEATVTVVDNDASTDATLSGLAVNDGSTDLLTFVPGTTTYTATVANDVETLTFTATKGDDGASVAYLDSDGNPIADADTAAGHQVPLDVGANAITVRVTAEDGTTQDYTVTVTRAEGLPTVTVAAAAGGETGTEGTDAAFTLSRSGATTAALTVTVDVSETGAVLKDANVSPSSVTFGAGAATSTLALATDDDDTDNDAGTVTVTLGTDTGYTVGDPGAATVAVSDNDVPVDFVLSVPATVAEDAVTVTVTVTATTAEDAPPATSVAVFLQRGAGSTATSGSDYGAVSESVFIGSSEFTAVTVGGQPRYRAANWEKVGMTAGHRGKSRTRPPKHRKPPPPVCDDPFVAMWMKIIDEAGELAAAHDREWMRRRRFLNSLIVMLFVFRLVLSRGTKGYATVVAELWDQCRKPGIALPQRQPVTASSICKARARVHENLFLDLHREILRDGGRWKDHRTFAIDGTKMNLPRPLANAHYPQGLVSCLYRIETKTPVDFSLSANADERAAARAHLDALSPGDVVVVDRGYFSFVPCLSGCHPHPLYVWCGDKWLGRRTKRGWMFCSGKTFRLGLAYLA